jgi:hypothetical protein
MKGPFSPILERTPIGFEATIYTSVVDVQIWHHSGRGVTAEEWASWLRSGRHVSALCFLILHFEVDKDIKPYFPTDGPLRVGIVFPLAADSSCVLRLSLTLSRRYLACVPTLLTMRMAWLRHERSLKARISFIMSKKTIPISV